MTPDDDIRRLLDAIPAPPVEPVDVAAIYRDAAALQARSARRWKRSACIGAFVAASVLLVALLPKLEVTLTGNEFVMRWGPADPPPAQPAPDESVLARLAELDVRVTRTAQHEMKLKDLEDLLLTLAADVDDRDGKRKTELATLARDLRLLRADTRFHHEQAEKTNAALYTAIFDKPRMKE